MESRLNLTFLALLAGLAMFGTPMRSHQGCRVSYDVSQKVILTGTVAQYIWRIRTSP
jgi:hypothetical protein